MDPIDPGNGDGSNNQPPEEEERVEGDEQIEEAGPDPFGRNLNVAEAIQRASDRIMMRQNPNLINLPNTHPFLTIGNMDVTPAQSEELERVFHNVSRFPDIRYREMLARNIGMPEHQVQTWFFRRRMLRRQAARRAATRGLNMTQDMYSPLQWPPPNGMFNMPNYSIPNYSMHLDAPGWFTMPPRYQPPVHQAPPPPPPAPRAHQRPDRDTEDQISQLVDNLDAEIGQLKKQLADEQNGRKSVEAELDMARRELEFLKNNSTSEVEELINMTAALELNKTGLAEQNTMLLEQVAQLQNRQIELEAELVKARGEGAEPAGGAEPKNPGEPDWMREEW